MNPTDTRFPATTPLSTFLSLSKLRWLEVDSSSVACIAYCREQQALWVQMRSNPDRAYRYACVSEDAFVALATAKSAGQHFVRHVRDRYATTRVALAVELVG
jgi:hypothetical protein